MSAVPTTGAMPSAQLTSGDVHAPPFHPQNGCAVARSAAVAGVQRSPPPPADLLGHGVNGVPVFHVLVRCRRENTH